VNPLIEIILSRELAAINKLGNDFLALIFLSFKSIIIGTTTAGDTPESKNLSRKK